MLPIRTIFVSTRLRKHKYPSDKYPKCYRRKGVKGV